MDKNEALKIMEGLKTIQKHCAKFKHCSDECECEFNDDTICILKQLGYTPDPYWNLGEIEEKLMKSIDTEEKQQHEAAQQDMIHHPGHYNFRGMECKDFIEKFVADPKSYYEGNIFKYLYRYLEKNKEEDLNKAMEYTRLLKEYLYGKNGKEE